MRSLIQQLISLAVSSLGLLSTAVYASLVPVDIDGNAGNGHEGVYDSVLDITWLANANLAQSNDFGLSGIGASGNMKWETAEQFVESMNALNSGAGYLGVNSWRHPTIEALDAGGTYNTSLTDNGASDFSYNLSAPQSVQYNPLGASPDFLGSELAYHYYNNFGAIGACNGTNTVINNQCASSQPESVYGIDDAPDPDNNKQLFTNLLNTGYWSGSELNASEMWLFSNYFGQQFYFSKDIEFHVWVVAPGNVAAVPLPAAFGVFCSALLALFGFRKVKARQW